MRGGGTGGERGGSKLPPEPKTRLSVEGGKHRKGQKVKRVHV